MIASDVNIPRPTIDMLTHDVLTNLLNQKPYNYIELKNKASIAKKKLELKSAASFLPRTSGLSKMNLGTPSKIDDIVQVRKRHLDFIDASDSPFKISEKTIFGKCPLSKRAIKHKKENDLTTGRNVAIIIAYDSIKKELIYTIDATDGPPGPRHAELLAYDALPKHIKSNKKKEDILLIYTERAPCKKGSDCHRKVKLVISKETKIVWNTDYSPTKSHRHKTEEIFRKMQEDYGVRAPKRAKKYHFDPVPFSL